MYSLWLVDFYRQYREQGLEVVGVSMDDGDWQQVADFVKEMKVNYTILMGIIYLTQAGWSISRYCFNRPKNYCVGDL